MNATDALAIGFGILIGIIAYSAMVLTAPLLDRDDVRGLSDAEIADLEAA